MTEVQQGLFKLLVELDDICKKHGITYYLIGGSALGAIRHQGFLPWDDDADIVLTRDNWEKLQKAFETDLPENRKCVGWHNYDEEPSVFFRYVDTTQTFLLHSLWDRVMPWGGIVDIFVLNPLPADPKKWEAYHQTMRRFGEYVMSTSILVNTKTRISSYLMDCIVGKIKGHEYVENKLYTELSRYSEEECTHYSYLYARLHIVYPKEIFQQPRYVPFEGRLFPVPTLAEEHLRILFGDNWFEIPADSDKVVHVALHDLHRSYREYMYDYLHYAQKDEVHKRAMRAKILKMAREKLTRAGDKRTAELRGRYLEKLFSQYFVDHREALEQMYAQKDYWGLCRFFAPFYSEQLGSVMQEYGIAIKIPDEYRNMALYAQIACGSNRKAKKILELYSSKKAADHGTLDSFLEILQRKNQLFLAFETKDATFPELADQMFRQFPYDKDVRIMKLWSELLCTDLEDAALERLLADTLKGEEQWPEESAFQKIHADILRRLGETEKAEQLYQSVAKTTRNGMLLLQMKNDLEDLGDSSEKYKHKEKHSDD